ncbi:ribbon-helix-helix domain-containing protein [Rhodopirellula europaea]|uniref:Transcriptional regulator, CopG/Arc/MetJ family n=1 Tax=Rhodopirellula europaea 6C TaxID=1263867 RepID=M2AKW0_9BACT|nr:CopG family transcriptional regulator [Rhodopirellula europaea]EMB13332.1 transcriptional regulator, CopG/Arc/MetJ family [Rhodopirellula europaea 6C]
MNLNLPSEVNDFVKGLVAQGRYSSEEDAIVEGIKLLMGREQLRGEIKKGVEQLDAGEFYDEETVFNEINAEIDKVEAEQQGS